MHELSPNNRNLKTMLVVVNTIVLEFFAIIVYFKFSKWAAIFVVLIIIIGMYKAILAYKLSENIFFDSNYLYLQGVSENREVSLSKISHIQHLGKRLKAGLTIYTDYNIKWVDDEKIQQTLKIWVNPSKSNVESFKNAVKSKLEQ